MSNLEHGLETCFKCLTIPRKQVQGHSKEFPQNKIIVIKRFLGKATANNDNYIINMGGQRANIDSN